MNAQVLREISLALGAIDSCCVEFEEQSIPAPDEGIFSLPSPTSRKIRSGQALAETYVCGWIMRGVYDEIHAHDIMLAKEDWACFFRLLQRAFSSDCQCEQNAIIGLLLSGLKVPQWLPDLVWALDSATFSVQDLPTRVTRLLHSPLAAKAHWSFADAAGRVMPSAVTVATLRSDLVLRGWVAFDNAIVVRDTVFERASCPEHPHHHCGVLDLFTLAGHLAKLGDVSRSLQQFGVHVPHNYMVDFVPVEEVGRRWELALWGGVWPMWYAPIRTEEAENLAATIAAQGRGLGSLTRHQASLLGMCVGDRRNFSAAATISFDAVLPRFASD